MSILDWVIGVTLACALLGAFLGGMLKAHRQHRVNQMRDRLALRRAAERASLTKYPEGER